MLQRFALFLFSAGILTLTIWGAKNGIVNESAGMFLFGLGVTSLFFKGLLICSGVLLRKKLYNDYTTKYYYVVGLYPIILLVCYVLVYLLTDISQTPFSYNVIFSIYTNPSCILGSIIGLIALYLDSKLLDKLDAKK